MICCQRIKLCKQTTRNLLVMTRILDCLADSHFMLVKHLESNIFRIFVLLVTAGVGSTFNPTIEVSGDGESQIINKRQTIAPKKYVLMLFLDSVRINVSASEQSWVDYTSGP